MGRSWALLFVVNAVAAGLVGVVLFVWPAWIPGLVGVPVTREGAFICSLLGAAELALATLCALTPRLRDPAAVQAVAATCAVFHAASGLAGWLGHLHGASAAVLWNVALRVAMTALFVRLAVVAGKFAH